MTSNSELQLRDRDNLKARALKGSVVISLANVCIQGSAFIRNVILARVLSKADFGVAITLSLVLGLFELTSKLGMHQLVVQDPEGDEPKFLGTVHLVIAFSSVLSSVAILLGSGPLAKLFGVEHESAFLFLAVYALLRGGEHLDVRRFQRRMHFGPAAFVDAVPELFVTLLAWPIAVALADFRAVLVLLLLKAAFQLLLSHVFADQPYRLQWDRNRIIRIWGFSYPLILNSLVLLGVTQGDRFLVASVYDLSSLAPYAAAGALAYGPSYLIASVFSSLSLPVLAAARHDSALFLRRYREVMSLLTSIGSVVAAGMIVGAESGMRILYGERYAGSGWILAWIVAAVTFRTLRIGPALAAIAHADTKNQLLSNMARATSLVPAFYFAVSGSSLETIAACGLIGELLSLWVNVLRLRRRNGVPYSATLWPALWLSVVLGSSGLLFWEFTGTATPIVAGMVAVAASILAASASAVVLPELRRECRQIWSAFQVSGYRGAVGALVGKTLR